MPVKSESVGLLGAWLALPPQDSEFIEENELFHLNTRLFAGARSISP